MPSIWTVNLQFLSTKQISSFSSHEAAHIDKYVASKWLLSALKWTLCGMALENEIWSKNGKFEYELISLDCCNYIRIHVLSVTTAALIPFTTTALHRPIYLLFCGGRSIKSLLRLLQINKIVERASVSTWPNIRQQLFVRPCWLLSA